MRSTCRRSLGHLTACSAAASGHREAADAALREAGTRRRDRDHGAAEGLEGAAKRSARRQVPSSLQARHSTAPRAPRHNYVFVILVL